MKKSTFIIGVVSSFIFIIGVAMKCLHWPVASTVILIGAALFAFGYAILLLIDKNKIAQNDFQKFVNIMSMATMLVIMVAFIFKIMHWPGARIGIYAGHILLLSMIPTLFFQGYKETDPVKKLNFNNIAILLVVLTAFSFFIWLGRSVG